MIDWEAHDNEIAYGYDDYVEPQEEINDDYLVDREIEFEALDYQSKMAEQMIESVNDLN